MNKTLKYNYLPKGKNTTLSYLVTVLIEEFLPESFHKYQKENFAMTEAYRSYNDFVPVYLRGRPRKVILLHCLSRMQKVAKFTKESIKKRLMNLAHSLCTVLQARSTRYSLWQGITCHNALVKIGYVGISRASISWPCLITFHNGDGIAYQSCTWKVNTCLLIPLNTCPLIPLHSLYMVLIRTVVNWEIAWKRNQ